MADAYSRPDSWLDYLPDNWQHSINTSPILNALGRALNRRPADIEGASKRIFSQPGDREMDDRAWLLQQAQPQRRLNPLAAEMLDKGGLLANFLGPSVKLPGVPRAPGRYAMEYPGGRIDYKDMDGGVHVSGIYTNPEARGQGNAKQALQELIAAADAAKRPMSLEISPGAPGVDPARLRQWYESLGFSGPDYAMTRQPPPAGIRAYHGSPHDFDRFDISKIGTGEGAQAYGRGLYFAENEGVARSYRDGLAGKAEPAKFATPDEAKRAAGIGGSIIEASQSMGGGWRAMGADGEFIRSGPSPGRMYEVNIKADPDQFLDWDKPLSQQPEGVRRALEAANLVPWKTRNPLGIEYGNLSKESALALSSRGRRPIEPDLSATGGDLLNWEVGAGRPVAKQETSDRLRDAGIPGIKYLDQQSRAAGQGSRNFVVFDDKLIEILRKYGLLPPVAAGTAAALNQQEPPL